jgi:hypothetical protein
MPSLQVTPAPPQTPLLHLSPPVHALPSLHGVLSALAGFEQTPLVGSQLPASWHWSLALHVTGFVPVQAPPWQVSVLVQSEPSTHVVPFCFDGFEHLPVEPSQVPAS